VQFVLFALTTVETELEQFCLPLKTQLSRGSLLSVAKDTLRVLGSDTAVVISLGEHFSLAAGPRIRRATQGVANEDSYWRGRQAAFDVMSPTDAVLRDVAPRMANGRIPRDVPAESRTWDPFCLNGPGLTTGLDSVERHPPTLRHPFQPRFWQGSPLAPRG